MAEWMQLEGTPTDIAAQRATPELGAVHITRVRRYGGAGQCFVEALQPTATADDADLFNAQDDLLFICVARGGSLPDALNSARQSAANTRPRTPEHTRMANNLLARGRGHALDDGSMLGDFDAPARRRLRNQLAEVNQLPHRMCYKCGLIMDYARNLPKCRVHDVAGLADCRAQRVFDEHVRK
jgi:hypothetical protein